MNFEMRFTYPQNFLVANRENYSRDCRGPADCSRMQFSGLGSARLTVHTRQIHEKQNGTILSIPPSPAERQRGRHAAVRPTHICVPCVPRVVHTYAPAVNTRRLVPLSRAPHSVSTTRCTQDTCGSEVRTHLKHLHLNRSHALVFFTLIPMHLQICIRRVHCAYMPRSTYEQRCCSRVRIMQ